MLIPPILRWSRTPGRLLVRWLLRDNLRRGICDRLVYGVRANPIAVIFSGQQNIIRGQKDWAGADGGIEVELLAVSRGIGMPWSRVRSEGTGPRFLSFLVRPCSNNRNNFVESSRPAAAVGQSEPDDFITPGMGPLHATFSSPSRSRHFHPGLDRRPRTSR